MKTTLENMVDIHSAQDAYTSLTPLEKYHDKGPVTYKKVGIITESVEPPIIIRHPSTGRMDTVKYRKCVQICANKVIRRAVL